MKLRVRSTYDLVCFELRNTPGLETAQGRFSAGCLGISVGENVNSSSNKIPRSFYCTAITLPFVIYFHVKTHIVQFQIRKLVEKISISSHASKCSYVKVALVYQKAITEHYDVHSTKLFRQPEKRKRKTKPRQFFNQIFFLSYTLGIVLARFAGVCFLIMLSFCLFASCNLEIEQTARLELGERFFWP